MARTLASLAVVALAAAIARADVVTSLSDSTLTITGDGNSSALSIDGAAGGVTITTRDGTLVDGSANPVTIAGVQRLVMKLGAGSDRVEIADVSVPGGLDLRLGRGNDDVVLDGVRGGSARVRTGNGYDSVAVFGASRFDNLAIETSNGRDFVDVEDAFVTGDLHIDAGAGDDDVTIFATDVIDDVRVRLGNDDDFLAVIDVAADDDIDVDGESGDDVVVFEGYVFVGDDFDVDGFDDVWW